MNKSHKEMLIELLDKYGKDSIISEIENILNPTEKNEVMATDQKRGRITTRTPEALFAIYSLVKKVMWQNNLNISRSCEKIATNKVRIEGSEVLTILSDGNGLNKYDEKNIRQWFYDARRYQKANPESVYGIRISACDEYYVALRPYSEIKKEMELMPEKYKS